MSFSGRLATWPAAVVLLALAYVAGVNAVAFAPQADSVAAWWPAAGLSVGLLVVQPRRRWPLLACAIVVLTALASITGGRDVGITVLFAIGNAAEALVAASVLRRGNDRDGAPRLDSTDVLLRLLVAAVLGGLAVTVVATVSVALTGVADPLSIARTFFTSHTAATLIVVPALLTAPERRRPLERQAELAAQTVALLALTLVVFSPEQDLSATFLPLPVLVWAALRLDLRALTWELVAFSIVVTLLSAKGWGPFGFDYERGAISASVMGALVQGYLLCAMLLTIPLAVAVDQRRRLIRDLARSEKLTNATLDTIPTMILVTDLYGVVVRINGGTTAVTGYVESDLVGRPIWEMPFAGPGSTGYPAGLPDEADSQVSRETNLITNLGQRRRVLWNTGYVRDERDRPTHVVITGTDLTQERRAAGFNRHILEAAITTALIGIDTDGRITVFNSGAVNLLGHDAQDIVGTPFIDLLDREQLAQRTADTPGETAFARLVAGVEAFGETAARDWVWIGADGHRHTVAMTLSAVTDSLTARYGFLCVGRDVTEARAGQEMLIAALEKERLAVQRMREVDAAKNDFVSTVSHELRTPVTSIVGYTEILEDGSLVDPAPEQRPLLASIARNGQRLILLCDDLLTLSGLDSGAVAWERGALDLTSIVVGAEDALRAQLVGRDLELVVTTADPPVPVLGDRGQLERVLTNLLSNAIKFTDDGGRIEVTIDVRDGEAILAVADTGIGIPEDEQSGLFERFFRSSTAQQRAIQGTGLGLSIVAAIVAAHGGRIDVRSAHLEGTTFTVRLPLARVGSGSPR
ncbi:ATP-binding protein [Nocardioides sp. YIM 152315]|uniref:ATP-binding protein n=1 Tax=Nocardioides sp. YIM 152315 TaxID=3031760 RepID=UPI0023DC88F8|nr:ATP-binding protein [Nocardioides sp. YIM 152315]MDF1603849.1 ATP-binding protein [Nocardioides sp. YIM 152315]